MNRLVHTVAALAAAAAFVPVSGAHAEDPFACAGSPEVRQSYVCLVRFQVGADPVAGQRAVVVPSQSAATAGRTVQVPGRNVGVFAGHTVHIPEVCGGPDGFCFGPVDATVPPVSARTPAATVAVPGQTVTTPATSLDVPTLTLDIPPGAALVVWYLGVCYYVYPNGAADMTLAYEPGGCP